MAVGDIFELRIYSQFLEQVAINVNHYVVDSSVGSGIISPNNVANSFSTAVATLFKACLVADALFYGISATRVFPTLGPMGISVGDQGVGTFAADAGARQVAGIISKQTVLGGGSGRGRMFVPFPAANASDPATGSPTLDYKTALAGLGGALQLGFSTTTGGLTETFEWVVFNRALPGSSPEVTSVLARGKWGTQRRRGDYGRPNVLPF